MTSTRQRLTREKAFMVLEDAGFPVGVYKANTGVSTAFNILQVAVATAESDLYVDAQGPPNSDGTVDRGWLQINSGHGFDNTKLLSDPLYTAACALQILLTQGLRAWAAYSVKNRDGQFPYVRHMPPGLGGPDLAVGSNGLMVVSVQHFLNGSLDSAAQLVEDGGFGPKTEAALLTWKKSHHDDGTKVVNALTWKAFGIL